MMRAKEWAGQTMARPRAEFWRQRRSAVAEVGQWHGVTVGS